MSEWFNREEAAPTILVKKPNPRNIQNATKLEELEREIERYERNLTPSKSRALMLTIYIDYK
jgi:hypothetical protein